MDVPRVRVALPGGSWLDGVRVGHASVRALTGADEAMLADEGGALLPVERTSVLLGRCVEVDGASVSGIDLARRLSVGDREALLLHLRRLTFGDRLECVLTCPNTECGEQMDLELSIADLLLPPYEHSAPWYDATGGADVDILRFRVATGADQEVAAELGRTDRDAAGVELTRRCTMHDADDHTERSVDDAMQRAVATAMLERDPQAEIVLDVTCPACGRETSTLFDAGTFLSQELSSGKDRLFREVHTLALHYHWSEAEILVMTRPRRQRYLGLLAELASEAAR